MPRGGARKGAGKPKGYQHKGTKEKLLSEALLRAMVDAELRPMVAAQIEASKGYKHLVARDRKGGKFKSITPEEVEKLNDPSLVTEIWEKHPSPEAFKQLLDRAYGRPAEKLIAEVSHEAGPKLEILLRNLRKIGNGNSGA